VTVSNTTNKHYYNGTGAQVSFPYAFKVFSSSDLTVYVDNILKTVDVDYSVSDVGEESGGNVVFTSAPASGTGNVAILRKLPLSQLLDLVQYGKFDAEVIEESFDRLVYVAQQLQEASDRTIRFAATVSDGNPQEITDTATDRAGKVLAYDSAGDLTVAQELGEWKGNWVTGTQYYVRDLIKDSATDNVYIALTNHVSAAAIGTDIGANLGLVIDAAAVATSAANAATSATNAATSETNAASSATSAGTSATNAAGSATAASTSATNASTSETNAATSATTATTKAGEASTSATNAASSASAASASATAASTSETNAATSATSAAGSATAAATSATSAATSATTATTKASEAATSATNAATSETNAATSATAASNSATSAATSATASASSATAAATSAANAALAYDSFDDRYLGAKSVEPTANNDGDPLISGNLYFHTGVGMKVYDGGSWIDASAASTQSMFTYEYTATASQTVFSGVDLDGQTLSYTPSNIRVYQNGIQLSTSDYTATDGASVTLNAGATVGDEVVVLAFASFTVADTYTKAEADTKYLNKQTGGTITGNVDVTGTVTADGLDILVDADDRITFTTLSGDALINSLNNTYSAYQPLLINGSDLRFLTGALERLRIDSSGNVGIGTSSPTQNLHISASTDTRIALENTSNRRYDLISGDSGEFRIWDTAVGERMRIDSSGNLLVGGTTAAEAGSLTVYPTGIVQARVNNNNAAIFDRIGSDGEILDIRKDGSTVGSIGVESGGAMYIGGTTGSDSFIKFNSNEIVPCTSSGGNRDNAIDLGNFLSAYKDAYLSGGVYLGGTGAANKLDDYETGTWTPAIYSGGVLSDATTANIEGTYTKVGRLVTCHLRWGFSNNGTDSGGLGITLPFVVADIMTSTAVQGGASLSWIGAVNVSHSDLYASPWEGTSEVRFGYKATSTTIPVSTLMVDQVANNFDGRMTVTYLTT
jgi:hypothetical protein